MATAAKSKRTITVRKKSDAADRAERINKATQEGTREQEEAKKEAEVDVLKAPTGDGSFASATIEQMKREQPRMEAARSKPPVKQVLDALGPGQKYFEAPDGTVLIGEEDKQQLWYRNGNNGKGCWINPKR